MSRRQVIYEGVVYVGAPIDQQGTNGPRRERKTKKSNYIPAPHAFFNSFGITAKSKL